MPLGMRYPSTSTSTAASRGEITPAGFSRRLSRTTRSAYLAGRDPSAWPDPLRFDPGRFADLTPEQQAVADDAWVPFGRGPRRCIGFALAQMELTLALARLVQRLDVEATGTLPRPVGMVVNRPTGGVPLRVRARAGDPSVPG